MYVFDELPIRSGLELVSAMRQRWVDATDLLDAWPDPPLKEWLRTRPDGDILILALDMEKSGGARLIRLQAEFDPDGPLEFQGARIDGESLERAIRDADPFNPESAADLTRFAQIELLRPQLNAHIETPRPSLSTQLGHRLHPMAMDVVRQIDSLLKSRLQSTRDRLQSMEQELVELQASPAVKAYRWLSDIRRDRILRSLAAVTEGPAAAKLLRADQLLSEWSGQTDSFLRSSVFSLHLDFWLSRPLSGQGGVDADDLRRSVRMASAPAERARIMLAYLFASALSSETPTEESTKAIESAASLLGTINAIEKMAPGSGWGGLWLRTRDAEVREKQEHLRQSVKELATQTYKSSPTDLGRLIPALPVMELLGMDMTRDLAELQARQKREAEQRAQREREQREAQERAERERKAAEKRADDERRERERLELETRKLRTADLQQRAFSLPSKTEGAKERITALQAQLSELRRQTGSMQEKIKSLEALLVQAAGMTLEQLEAHNMKLPRWQGYSPEPQDTNDRRQLVEQVGRVVLDARQDANKIQHELGKVSLTDLDALSPARLEKVRDAARSLTTAEGRKAHRQLEMADREIQEVERAITSITHHQRSLANLSEQIVSVNHRVEAASDKPREFVAKQRRLDIWSLAVAVPIGAFVGGIAGTFGGMILALMILWATGTNGNSPEWNLVWFGVLWPTVIVCAIFGAWRPIRDFQKNTPKVARG